MGSGNSRSKGCCPLALKLELNTGKAVSKPLGDKSFKGGLTVHPGIPCSCFLTSFTPAHLFRHLGMHFQTTLNFSTVPSSSSYLWEFLVAWGSFCSQGCSWRLPGIQRVVASCPHLGEPWMIQNCFWPSPSLACLHLKESKHTNVTLAKETVKVRLFTVIILSLFIW